ncbi:DUF86 domain-containing protein [Candidatus Woesearchaeota archaeon]|nr:DUF86 domain-containing protein [Candidatus Woesearchaeota archaeon]
MAIDKKLIFRKINLIIRDLEKVRSISMLSWQEYKKKSEYEALAERYLERIIGRMIDINFHLIIESGHAPPEDYFSSFRMLGELRIISHDLAKRFARLAGLRNRLAHEYDAIDEKKIYNELKNVSKELPVYLTAVEKFSDKNNRQKRIKF